MSAFTSRTSNSTGVGSGDTLRSSGADNSVNVLDKLVGKTEAAIGSLLNDSRLEEKGEIMATSGRHAAANFGESALGELAHHPNAIRQPGAGSGANFDEHNTSAVGVGSGAHQHHAFTDFNTTNAGVGSGGAPVYENRNEGVGSGNIGVERLTERDGVGSGAQAAQYETREEGIGSGLPLQ